MKSELLSPPNVSACVDLVHARRPEVKAEIGPGGDIAKNWWIVFTDDSHEVVVEWHPTQGYGVYALDGDGYGEKPSEVFSTAEEAANCVTAWLPSSALPPAGRAVFHS